MQARFKILTIGVFAMIATSVSSSVALASAAPQILSPHANQSFSSGPVMVAGVSDDSALVEVWEDSQMVGSDIADGAGVFQILINVGGFGSHTIKARELGPDLTYSPFSATVTFTTDFAPATPEVTSPASGSHIKTTSILVGGHADNNATVTLKEGTTTRASGLVVSARSWSTTLTFTEGSHTVNATATDPKGRTSATSSVSFVVDTTPPAAPVITAPAAGSYTASTNVSVTGSAEASSTVTVYEGPTARGSTTANGSGSWSIALTFGQGSHSIIARSTDLAGNQGTASPARSFIVDTTAPGATITTADDSVFLPGTATIQGTATDNFDVARIELHYSTATGSDVKTVNAASCTGCGTPNATWNDPETSLAAGVYKVSATAIDGAGNRSGSTTISFVVV